MKSAVALALLLCKYIVRFCTRFVLDNKMSSVALYLRRLVLNGKNALMKNKMSEEHDKKILNRK